MRRGCRAWPPPTNALPRVGSALVGGGHALHPLLIPRSEEHTSELQAQSNLVCRHLLQKKFSGFNSPLDAPNNVFRHFTALHDEPGRFIVDGMNTIRNEGSIQLNRTRQAKDCYQVQRPI